MPKPTKPKAPAPDQFLDNLRSNIPLDTFIFKSEDKLIDHLNGIVGVVSVGNDKRFAFRSDTNDLVLMSKHNAEIELAQFRLKTKDDVKNGKSGKSGFATWLKSSKRREYSRIVFNPNPATVGPDELNEWPGFAIKPKRGRYPLMQEHLRENICNGNEANLKFLLAVIAQIFQQPWEKVGVAVVLIGEMGVGKTVLLDWLAKMIGPKYCPVIDKPHQLTGRFRGQLEFAILALVEEGFYPKDPEAKATMKHLITGHTLMIEKKGREAYNAPNFTRVILATNSHHAIAAQTGERRYFVQTVGNKRKQDGAFFAALHKEMEYGGAAAFMHDLLSMDISQVDFSKPPMTTDLMEQIRLGFSDEEKWYEAVLSDGELPFNERPLSSGDTAWPTNGELMVTKDCVVESFRDFVPGYRGGRALPQAVGTFLNRHIDGLKETRLMNQSGSRERYWVFPPLKTLRASFLAKHPGYVFPDLNIDEETEAVVALSERRGRVRRDRGHGLEDR